ncbi:Myotubularin-like protein [Quillaja saponaria]|uniref:Myotubularin-like protein n=1 Tax=Quillaja saponaria TaxID=32244 RepID=A0AAD7PLD8_QUISA|nr:Myotubularin-like protein [Quillaja saponaria]
MANEHHHHHHHHHHFYNQNLHIHQKSTFLPMLCSRPSIRDVTIPRRQDRASSFPNDPLSPRIGCTGQVKRSNRILAFPTSQRLSDNTTTTFATVKYSKLKKLFSGKNLTNPKTNTTTNASGCGISKRQLLNNGAASAKNCGLHKSETFACVSIKEMDPPLPVIKRPVAKSAEGGEEVNSLWKRRSGRVALKSLQLQQIHHPGHHLQPTTV